MLEAKSIHILKSINILMRKNFTRPITLLYSLNLADILRHYLLLLLLASQSLSRILQICQFLSNFYLYLYHRRCRTYILINPWNNLVCYCPIRFAAPVVHCNCIRASERTVDEWLLQKLFSYRQIIFHKGMGI